MKILHSTQPLNNIFLEAKSNHCGKCNKIITVNRSTEVIADFLQEL